MQTSPLPRDPIVHKAKEGEQDHRNTSYNHRKYDIRVVLKLPDSGVAEQVENLIMKMTPANEEKNKCSGS